MCDIYQPSIDEALKLAPKAKVYGNYKEVLEDKNIDAVLVATPLSAHYKIVMDAFDAGKHVFCEKSIGYTMEECYHIYQKHRSTGKIFFTGQQRLFDPRLYQGDGNDPCGYVRRNQRNSYFLEPEWRLETFCSFTKFGASDKLASL